MGKSIEQLEKKIEKKEKYIEQVEEDLLLESIILADPYFSEPNDYYPADDYYLADHYDPCPASFLDAEIDLMRNRMLDY